ncbi:hypothetical protein FF38_02708 [Lucilia cuprina]|uniref:Uncharacterized protein n=1 Tax=Lucilia cuprina TaxID=7375 RepID=A0A0L0CKA0_LUCCU|nr:hypothetical protein FF38_02708 [Lucilia cuprina]
MLNLIILLTFLKCLNSFPITSEKSSIVRIYTKGIMPYETDVLLPYSIIHKIYHQQISGHQPLKTKIHAVIRPDNKFIPKYRKSRNNLITPTRNSPKGHIHFQRDRFNARNFKLFDDDGEYLLNLKYPDELAIDAIQHPVITNTTTMYVNKGPVQTIAGNTNRDLEKLRSSKKVVQHVWINLK